MLLRLPYLMLTSVFTFIRLLPMSDIDKNIEILTRRHQLAILQRKIDKPRLCRSKSRRRTSSRVTVFVDEAAEDLGAQQSGGVDVHRDRLLGFGW